MQIVESKGGTNCISLTNNTYENTVYRLPLLYGAGFDLSRTNFACSSVSGHSGNAGDNRFAGSDHFTECDRAKRLGTKDGEDAQEAL